MALEDRVGKYGFECGYGYGTSTFFINEYGLSTVLLYLPNQEEGMNVEHRLPSSTHRHVSYNTPVPWGMMLIFGTVSGCT
jgi:hypothetical protein